MNRIFHNLRPRTWLDRARSARTDLRDTTRSSGQTVSVATSMQAELASQQKTMQDLHHKVDGLAQQLAGISDVMAEHRQRLLLALRMVRDDDSRARHELLDLRSRSEYQGAFDESEPLVSVVIATYNNWKTLRDRSLPSVIAQTYENWECIVVGDCAPEETQGVIDSLGDDRIRFVNLPYRGPYPQNAKEAWMISGTPPLNTALALAQGKWIAPHSDDDALRPQALDLLMKHAKCQQAEFVYGYLDMIHPDETVTRLGEFPPRYEDWNTTVTTSGVALQGSLLHAGLRFLPLLPSDWVFEIPNDLSLIERMLRIGVRFSMLQETTVDYYPSLLWDPDRQLAEGDD